MKYYNITVNVSKREALEMSGSLFLSGADSVTESENAGTISMTALVRDDLVDSVQKLLSKREFSVEELPEKNWVDEWIPYFEPVNVGNAFTVIPYDKCKNSKEDSSVIIKIDPRGAFGSGTHPTTYMCLLAVKDEIDAMINEKPGLSVVDAGTGSGILAIAAQKCGARLIDAFDTDPDAIERAKLNSRINNTDGIKYYIDSIESFNANKGYDIVIANLQSFLIEKYFKNIMELANNNGVLILSGIYRKWRNDIAKMITANGCSIKKIEEKDEWICITALKSVNPSS